MNGEPIAVHPPRRRAVVKLVELPKAGAVRAWIFGFVAALLVAVAFCGTLFECVRPWTRKR